MRSRRLLIPLLAIAAGLALAACGGSEPGGAEGAEEPDRAAEDSWLALLDARDLEPDRDFVAVEVTRDGDELVVVITVPADAPSELVFGDGLYGAEAWGWLDGNWARVDTADVRTLIAPLLAPGESAEVRLPVRDVEAPPRVLVPVGGNAAWGDGPGA